MKMRDNFSEWLESPRWGGGKRVSFLTEEQIDNIKRFIQENDYSSDKMIVACAHLRTLLEKCSDAKAACNQLYECVFKDELGDSETTQNFKDSNTFIESVKDAFESLGYTVTQD